MRNIVVILAVILLLVSSVSNAQSKSNSASIQWQNYSSTVFDQAKNNKQSILLYGKSNSCHWCQEMDKTTWKTDAIIQMVNTNFIPVILDVDAQMNIALRYRISSLPSVMIVDADNRVIKIFSGYFSPEFMENNLRHFAKNITTASSENPEVVKSTPSTTTAKLLPDTIRENLNQNYMRYLKSKMKPENIEIDSVEYAVTSSDPNKSEIATKMKSIIHSQQALLDSVWGGLFDGSSNSNIYYEKKTALQASALQLYSQIYSYWRDPLYLTTADKLVKYIFNHLTSPEGVFYAGQRPYSADNEINKKYYKLSDKNRLKVGVPSVDKRILTNENGLVISGLAYYYMMKGDNSALAKAVKATNWIVANLSIPGGGFRHEKNENQIMYLGDTLSMGNAFLALYKATTNPNYLNRAVDAAHFIDKYFKSSNANGGFVGSIDLTKNSDSALSLAENADIVRFAALLYHYTGDTFLKEMQTNAFRYLMTQKIDEDNSPAVVLMSDYRITNKPLQITIVGSKKDAIANNLYKAALSSPAFYSRVDWWDRSEGPLLNSSVTYPVLNKSAAFICHEAQCSLPIFNTKDLSDMIASSIPGNNKNSEPPEKSAGNKVSKLEMDDVITNPFHAEKLLTGKSWIFVVIGFLGFGLLLSFTPCILPLVPIMASIIVGQTIGVKKEKTFLLCLAYVLAMSFTYAALGLLAGVFGIYLQVYMQMTWVVVLFSLLFLLLSLSMLGAYELEIPHAIQKKIGEWSNLQKGGTYFGVIVMGVLSTLIVSPCVSAPLAGALSFIAKTSDYLFGAVALFFMGLGMGLPLLAISVFSKNILPKASRWNNEIKSVFGIILLGLSVLIISRVLPLSISLMLWSAVIIFTTIYMGLLKKKAKNLFKKFWKTITIMLFVYGVSLFCYALFINTDFYRHSLSMNDRSFAGYRQGVSFKDIKSSSDFKAVFEHDKAKSSPYLLDFTAAWCASCINMERTVFTDPEVIKLMNQFILLRVDLTDIKSESMEIARQFSVSGPPVILFFDRQGKLNDLRAVGDMNVEQFKKILQQALEKTGGL